MKLIAVDSDLIPIGKGGFAEAFKQKSTGKVLKKLMPEVALDARSRHRFKREFEIMRDLAEVPGVLRVYDFNESNCSYTMEAGETTLLEFMSNPLSEEIKMTIIEQIVSAMADIHSRGYIHRDLSPTNIFLLGGQLKIADFGLGKNLNTISSYQTTNTNNYGQWFYCSPEQLVYLRDGDKRSDVFFPGKNNQLRARGASGKNKSSSSSACGESNRRRSVEEIPRRSRIIECYKAKASIAGRCGPRSESSR